MADLTLKLSGLVRDPDEVRRLRSNLPDALPLEAYMDVIEKLYGELIARSV